MYISVLYRITTTLGVHISFLFFFYKFRYHTLGFTLTASIAANFQPVSDELDYDASLHVFLTLI